MSDLMTKKTEILNIKDHRYVEKKKKEIDKLATKTATHMSDLKRKAMSTMDQALCQKTILWGDIAQYCLDHELVPPDFSLEDYVLHFQGSKLLYSKHPSNTAEGPQLGIFNRHRQMEMT